jgi:hypothetical protein
MHGDKYLCKGGRYPLRHVHMGEYIPMHTWGNTHGETRTGKHARGNTHRETHTGKHVHGGYTHLGTCMQRGTPAHGETTIHMGQWGKHYPKVFYLCILIQNLWHTLFTNAFDLALCFTRAPTLVKVEATKNQHPLT